MRRSGTTLTGLATSLYGIATAYARATLKHQDVDANEGLDIVG